MSLVITAQPHLDRSSCGKHNTLADLTAHIGSRILILPYAHSRKMSNHCAVFAAATLWQAYT